MKFTSIHIIYNPNSTGPSQSMAKDLRHQILRQLKGVDTKLVATKHAGHAEELSYKAAKSSKRPLIISASGDGGYNEVINGAMKAQTEGAKPICAVLPAGNANDHSRTLHEGPLSELIVMHKISRIDLIKITYCSHGEKSTRYAHSYIGLGLTPVVAVELNKTSLNALKELLIVLKTFYKFRPFKIQIKDKVMKLDSIIFTNIGQMAKVLTVSKYAKPDDGLFEVVVFPHSRKTRLLGRLAKAAVSSLKPTKKYKTFNFKVLKRMPIQLDGEVTSVDAHSEIQIESAKHLLTTIISA